MTDGHDGTEVLPILAVQRNRRRDGLEVATRGYGFPVRESVSESANESFCDTMAEVRESVDLDVVDAGDKLGTLTVDEDSREVLDFELLEEARADGGHDE